MIRWGGRRSSSRCRRCRCSGTEGGKNVNKKEERRTWLTNLVGMITGGGSVGDPLARMAISEQPMKVSFSLARPEPDWPVVGSVPQLLPAVYFHWKTQWRQAMFDGSCTRTVIISEPYLFTSRNFVESVPAMSSWWRSRHSWVASADGLASKLHRRNSK